MAQLRVVLDTNVLVSGLAFPNSTPGKLVALFRHGLLKVVLSDFILEEVARVLPRLGPLRFTDSEAHEVAEMLRFSAELVKPRGKAKVHPRDPNDLPVLLTLLVSKADFLITGDKNLLELAPYYPILSPAAFWERFGG